MAIEFDFSHEAVSLYRSTTMADVEDVERSLGITLPMSYKRFVTEVGNGLWAEIGGAFGLFRIRPGPNGEDEGFTLLDSVPGYVEGEWIDPGVPLLPFGETGSDGETWAFYTGKHSLGDEYPIVLLIPAWPHQYVVLHSSFPACVNFNLHYEAISQAEELNEEQAEVLWNDLYARFDPVMQPVPMFDFYPQGATSSHPYEPRLGCDAPGLIARIESLFP